MDRWLVGPIGRPGEQGEQGIQGEQGEQGAAGTGGWTPLAYLEVTTSDSTSSAIPADGTIPQSNEGKAGPEIEFTPSAIGVRVRCHGEMVANLNTQGNPAMALFLNDETDARRAVIQLTTGTGHVLLLCSFEFEAASTDLHTLKVRYGPVNGAHTMYVGGLSGTVLFGAAGGCRYWVDEAVV